MGIALRTCLMLAAAGAGFITAPAKAETASATVIPGTGTPMPPLSAYGDLPDVEDAVISPDGSRVAVLVALDDGSHLAALMTNDLKVTRKFGLGLHKVRGISWGSNSQLLIETSDTQRLYGFTTDKHEFTRTFIVPVDEKAEVSTVFASRSKLVPSTFGSYGTRVVNGRSYAYFGAVELGRDLNGDAVFDHGEPSLYRVDVASNQPGLVQKASGAGIDNDWVVDASGEVAARLDRVRSTGSWSLLAGGKTIARGSSPTGSVYLVGLGNDGKSVIYRAPGEDGDLAYFEIPLTGGEPAQLFKDKLIERLYFDSSSSRLLGYLEASGPTFFDPAHQAAMTKIRKTFRKYDLRVVDFTPDLGRAIVQTSGNLDSGSWFMVDVANLTAAAIGYERPGIESAHVGAISTVRWKAADGLEIDGVLTLPPGREAKNLPVIMLPHGGPSSADRARFDWWAQAFASRGYAVLQPNFRGSNHRGADFQRAGWGEWGGKMQTDVSDGLASLAAQGIVDPKRACIAGASYGGYAALAGVTIQQGLYRCAVAVAPVSDLATMFDEDYTASGEAGMVKRSLMEELGPRANWAARSPRRNAAKADAPILLIHGKDDTVVPYSHSTRMADALRDAGKPVELVTLANEDHWLSRAATRKQMLQAAVDFVEKHNPPRP